MPNATSNRIFISIAVSRPGGGLEPLPGAITAAKRMATWAQAQGYGTVLLHDEDLPEITTDLLRDTVSAAIDQVTDRGAVLDRLVIFFAGHGAALAIGDQYWILTHWHKRPTEAIKVSSLQRMLEYYGPRQVSIIGDACQEFSSRFLDLVGSAVLDRPDEAQQPYELDQFFAVDVGKQAFMIKASGDKESFCVFTEVLLDALQGDTQESSFETIGKARHVTSQSLARYLANNVEREAGKYGVRMSPRPRPGFYTDTVYLTLPEPLPKPPRPRKKAGASSTRSSLQLDGVVLNLDAVLQTGMAPAAKGTSPLRSVSKAMLIKPRSTKTALAAQTAALQDARENSRKAFFDEVAGVAVRDHFETGCGICVSGADVVQVQAAFGEVSAVQEQPNWFRINLHTGTASSPWWTDTLVTLADGRVVPVCAVDGFVVALHIIDAASLSLFHRPIGGAEHEGKEAIDLLARMHAGLLDLQTTMDATALLRHGKHRIITLGCVAAQFYDAVRDVDSLRSLAAFYAMHHQPVPLDILLYGGGTLSDLDGHLYADIPAVAARQARTEQESQHSFSCDPTPAFQRWPVAGRIPWMRQAWDAVVTARCDSSAADWRRQALSAMEFLAPGLFTIARPEGHEALATLAGIQTLQHEPSPYLSL